MSDRKTIQVNMDLFDIPSSKKTRKKKDPAEKKEIKVKNNHNKTTKNKLLRYIREQQEKNYEKLFESKTKPEVNKPTPIPTVLANSNSEFEKSIAYMKTIEDENKKKTTTHSNPHNATIKQRMAVEERAFHTQTPVSPVSLNSYPNIIETIQSSNTDYGMQLKPRTTMNLPTPTYGCLKNGNLPTYRSMMQQTIKNHSPHITITNPTSPSISTSVVPPTQMPSAAPAPSLIQAPYVASRKEPHIEIPMNTRVPQEVRQEQLKSWSELNQLRAKMQESKQGAAPKNLKYLKRKKTLRRTYNVGKSKVHPKVGVLVTNRTIRKKISTQAQQLKQMPIEEIRRYLTQKGLIKVGSIAPNDVLRQMYENAVLIGGDVNNHNSENLLYNYLHGK